MTGAVEALYKAYKGKVQFFLVYIREAHPARRAAGGGKPRKGPAGVTQHKTLKERMIAADKCMKGLKLTIPTLLDSMDGAFLKTYGGFPAGTAVVDIDGKIAYWNRGAPNGCKPPKAAAAIKKLLAAGGGAIAEKWAAVKVPPDGRGESTTQPAKGENAPAEKPRD